MLAGKGIVRIERMVELGIEPAGSGVADGAVPRQAKRHVRRVLAVGEVGRVA
jgi:hypothetical protein